MAGFREHRERLALIQAQADSLQGKPVQAVNAAYQSVEIVLQNEVNKIKAIPTLAERAEYKRLQFLPKFRPLVDEYFAKGEHYQNDVIGYCIMYLVDTGDFEQALALADKAIEDGQAMPSGIYRTIPEFIADAILQWANTVTTQGQSCEPYFSQVLNKITTSWQIHETPRAKWLKTTAQLLLNSRALGGNVKTALVNEPERLELAIRLLYNAHQLNFKIGVKSLIERCFMRLSALIQVGVYTDDKQDYLQGELVGELVPVKYDLVTTYLQRLPLTLDEVIKQKEGLNV